MTRVAIVTDSASDLTPTDAARADITVVPLTVSFGDQEFRAGVDLTAEDFWDRMLAPDAPFPRTAAPPPGAFKEAFERRFAEGADEIVCVDLGGRISATVQSARVAAEMLPGRTIEVVDSESASMGVGILALVATELAAAGANAAEIAAALGRRMADVEIYVAVDTLEYLKRGGRISGARAAVGTLLSVKPIITIRDGLVEQLERARTMARARQRVIELFTAAPADRVAILAGPGTDTDGMWRDLLVAFGDRVDPSRITVEMMGPTIGPHIGPGFVGGVVLRRR
ncbi:MAG: DegV family protein [Chloroflexota bacterium]